MIAEWRRRKDRLWSELDFAVADVLTWYAQPTSQPLRYCPLSLANILLYIHGFSSGGPCSLVANFAAVWLSAPALGGAAAVVRCASWTHMIDDLPP